MRLEDDPVVKKLPSPGMLKKLAKLVAIANIKLYNAKRKDK